MRKKPELTPVRAAGDVESTQGEAGDAVVGEQRPVVE
jgi:hypothetical protein